MRPPFKITPKINSYISDISRLLGKLESVSIAPPDPNLRKKNRIKTIKSTLAIEGNTFTEEQITAILENKKVIGDQREILEVKNAIKLYDTIDRFKAWRENDFLKAHAILMKNIISSAGSFRTKNVGILKGPQVKHLAPGPNMVPELMNKLFSWIKTEKKRPKVLNCWQIT